MRVQLTRLQWGRAFLTAVLVFILDIIFSAVLDWLAGHIWSQPDQQLMLEQFLFWSALVLQVLLTFVGAVWLARNVKGNAPLHGLIMSLFIVPIFYPTSLGMNNPALMMAISVVLTLAAGWLGGVLGSREHYNTV